MVWIIVVICRLKGPWDICWFLRKIAFLIVAYHCIHLWTLGFEPHSGSGVFICASLNLHITMMIYATYMSLICTKLNPNFARILHVKHNYNSTAGSCEYYLLFFALVYFKNLSPKVLDPIQPGVFICANLKLHDDSYPSIIIALPLLVLKKMIF
jgi:hypothetical protein